MATVLPYVWIDMAVLNYCACGTLISQHVTQCTECRFKLTSEQIAANYERIRQRDEPRTFASRKRWKEWEAQHR